MARGVIGKNTAREARDGKTSAKYMRDALRKIACDVDPKLKKKKAEILAERLWAAAMAGDISAIKEVNDRIDGKSVQGVELTGDEGGPLVVNVIGRGKGN